MSDGMSGIENIDLSLSGMRELSGKITQKQTSEETWATNYAETEQKRRDAAIAGMGEVKILDPQQVYLNYGFEIPQGYQLKLTPTVTGQDDFGNPTYDYGVSYLTPDSWEITTEGVYISPDGEQTNEQGYYSYLWNQQYQQAVSAAPEGFEFVASNSEDQDFSQGFIPLEGDYVPTQETVDAYYNSILSSTISESGYYNESGTLLDDLPLNEDSYLTPEQAATFGIELEEGWSLKLTPIPTPVSIDWAMSYITPGGYEFVDDGEGEPIFIAPDGTTIKASDITDPTVVGIPPQVPEQAEVSGLPEEVQRQIALQEYKDIPIPDILQGLIEGTIFFDELPDEIQTSLDAIMATPEGFLEYMKGINYEQGIKILFGMFPDADKAELVSIYMKDPYEQANEWSFWGQLIAGVGDFRAGLAGMMDWLGWDAASEFLMVNTEQMQAQAVGYEGDASGWGVLWDPAWWGTTALRSTPTTFALIAVGLATGGTLGAVLGTGFWGTVATAIGGGAASRLFESAIEAGGTYSEAIQSGKTEQQASDMAQGVFNKNMSLVGFDILQYAVAFTPAAKVITSLASKGLAKVTMVAGELVITAVTEAGEEYLQEVFQKMARGDKDVWQVDEEMQEVMALGGAMGIFFYGSGKVTQSLQSNAVKNLPEGLQETFRADVNEALSQGKTQEEATQEALDKMAQTPEGQEAIHKATWAATTELLSKQLQHISGDETMVAELPMTDSILDNQLKDSIQSKIASKLSDFNVGKHAVGESMVRAIDPRAMISRTSEEIKHVTGRAAIVRNYMMAVGLDMGESFKFELRAISDNPQKLFQLDKTGTSKTLSEGLKSDKPGTIEDIFLHPDKYKLTPRQKAYIDKMMVLVERGKNFLRNEGLYEHGDNFGEWIHRVVVGQMVDGKTVLVKGKPGRGSKALGAKRAYEKHRAYETQAEGVLDNMLYDSNPENWMGTYLEDVFIKIGDARFAKLVEHLGETPAEILDKIRPELGDNVKISKEQLAHITKLQSLAQMAKRIKAGDIPASSIRSVAKHYPELVARLKRLLPKTSKAYNEIIKASQDLAAANKANREYIDNLEAEAKKDNDKVAQAGKKPAPSTETSTETSVGTETPPLIVDLSPKYLEFTLPESGILEQTFKSMRPEDRIALLDNFERQFGEIERLSYEAEENAITLDEAVEDFLKGNSAFRLNKIQQIYYKLMKRKDNLRRVTLKEYREITGRPNPPSTVPIIYGEKGHKYVDWDLALDFVTSEYGFDSTEEMFDALERNAGHMQRHKEAVDLSHNLNRQYRQMSDVIKILQNVMITNQEYVPADITGSEAGVTPAQIPITITRAMMLQLESFGYSSEEINNMEPSEAWDLINGTMVEPSPAPAQAESLESLKQKLSDMLEINAEVETFTQEEIASLEKEIAEREYGNRGNLAFEYESSQSVANVKEPWQMTKEEFIANPPKGYKYSSRIKGEASNERVYMDNGERVGVTKVGDKFFNLDENGRRYVLLHESGHDFADSFMKEDFYWKVSDSGIFGEGKTNPKGEPYYEGILGTFRADEAVAEAYALYKYNPSELERMHPKAFAFIDSIIKGTAPIDALELAINEPGLLSTSPEGGIETKIPEPIEGEPEPGVSRDFWGYEAPVRPKGKGIVTQISMDDQVKLQEYYKENGQLPTDKNYVIEPVDNLDDLSEPPKFYQMENEPPSMMDEKQRQAELNDLVKDIKLIKAGKLDSYNKARAERKYELEKVRQGGIDKGYIMQPMFGGKIYDDAFIDEVKRWYLDNRGSNIVGKIAEVSGTLRVTKAALDLSVMAIQGMPTWGLAHSYLFVNPKMGLKMMAAWYKSFVISTGAFFAPHIAYRYLQENSQARMQRAALGGSTRAIDIFAGLHQQGFMTALLSHRLSLFNRAEIAFVTGGEMVRNTFWEIMSEEAMKNGDEQQLVMFLDRMTGVMNTEAMGVPTLARQIESAFLWFAPQYTRACLSVLNHLFKGGYNGKMARRALGGMVVAGSIFYMAILFAQGMLEGKDEEEIWERILEGFGWTTDPITGEGRWAPNARFMSITIGDRNYGIGGFWYGLVRLVGNIGSVIQEEGDKEIIDLVKIMKNGKLNKDNPFVYWWYCRASPFTGLVNDLATHRDFLGYPIETWDQYLEYFLTLFEPIWIEGALNPALGIGNEEPGDPDGLVLNIIGEIFGLRVNRKYAWQAFYDKAEEYITHMTRDELNKNQIEAWEKGKLGWKQLDKRQQLDLLAKYPDLKELQEAAEIDSALRDDSLWADWNEVIDRAKKTYYDEVKVLSDQFRAGEISSNEYRDGLRDAGLKYGSALSIIESDKRFEGLYEFLENTSESGAQYEYEFNKALADYQANIQFADDLEDEDGNYDWELRDARVKAFIDEWGMDMYEGILQYFETKKKAEGADDLYLKKISDVEKIGREYWDIEPDAKDIDGNNMRNAYRQSHPEIDAMLAFWGYGGRLQTKEAYDIVKGWAKEYGVPLSSVGKGLPPDYLVGQYFEYSSILNDYSPASAEMQLFRYNNPQFNDWAMEEWGWQELNIKSVEALEIKTKWGSQFNEYESAEDKQAYLETNTEFWKAKLEYDAYTNELPEEVIPDYQEWYMTDMSGYNDDIYLIEHPEFYNAMVEAGLWKERDFSKVPSRVVSELWDEYNTLPAGNKRKQFRIDNPSLDAWLVEVKGYTPVSDDYLDVPREEVFAMT